MAQILKLTKHLFNKHPIVANSVVYSTLYVGAEFSQQIITKKVMKSPSEPFDTKTLGRYTVYGAALAGPLLTLWYRWLDNKFAGKTFKVISRKLVLDQFIMTPNLVVLFFVAMSVMERKPDVFEECKQKFVQTFQSNCAFWLPAQTINFLLVPPALRVVYVGTCSFAWVNILCWIKRQEY